MREALRRILWLAPMLIVVTVLAFWALSQSLQTPENQDVPSRRIPLFFNTSPTSLQDLAWELAVRVAENEHDGQAAQALVRLGAAGLPHIWPKIDVLSPEGRKHVALALVPVAYRMRVAEAGTLQEGETALAFWNGYWRDHAVDFRTTTLKRVVKRFSKRATPLRRRELLQFDTFALEEILQQLLEANAARDLAAQRRLCGAAAHATGKDVTPEWTLARTADDNEADRVVARWQGWWNRHRVEYVTIQGFERLLSPVLQTRYALWAREAARTQFGLTSAGRPALDLLIERAPITLALLAAGLLGGTLLGLVVGAVVGALRQRALSLLETTSSLVWLAIPVAVVAAYAVPAEASRRPWSALVLMLLLGSALVARYQRSTMLDILDKEWVRTYRAVGASRLRIAFLTLRASSGAAISTIAPHTSTLLTAVFVFEHAFGLNGVGRQTIEALHEGDVVWLMLVTLATASLVGLIQIATDLLLRQLDPKQAHRDELELSLG